MTELFSQSIECNLRDSGRDGLHFNATKFPRVRSSHNAFFYFHLWIILKCPRLFSMSEWCFASRPFWLSRRYFFVFPKDKNWNIAPSVIYSYHSKNIIILNVWERKNKDFIKKWTRYYSISTGNEAKRSPPMRSFLDQCNGGHVINLGWPYIKKCFLRSLLSLCQKSCFYHQRHNSPQICT